MPTHSIAPIVGTNQADTLRGSTRSEVLDGRSGDDYLHGNNGNDILFGGKGDDELHGGSGDDVLHGSRSAGLGQFQTIDITEDYSGSVIWGGETAGYRNSVGMYKVDSETGQIGDVEIIWENASNQGSGGNLVIGQSRYDFDLSAGDQIGFFIVSNGYSHNNWSQLQDGSFEFRDADTGAAATLSSSHPALVHIAENGSETVVRHHTYHSAAHDETIGLNADGHVVQSDGSVGLLHTVGNLDVAAGTLTLGFEDLFNGGDKDFDDTVFTVDIGTANAQVLNAHANYGGGGSAGQSSARATLDAEGDVDGGAEGAYDLSYVGVTNKDAEFAARFKLHNEGGFEGLLSGTPGGQVTFEISIDTDGTARTDLDPAAAWDRKLVVTTDGATTSFTVQTWSAGSLVGSTAVDGSLVVDADGEARLAVAREALGLAIGDSIHWTATLVQDGTDSLDVIREYSLASSDDTLHGGTGDDQLKGYDGDDKLYGNNDDDNLDGGTGDDQLYGGNGDDILTGANGGDRLQGDNGDDVLNGGAGDDSLYGGNHADQLDGGSGDDLLSGGNHADTLAGSTGDDALYGEAHEDSLDGGKGDDLLDGGSHDDHLSGGFGDDILRGGDHEDVLLGGKGNDTLDGGRHDDVLDGGFGDDSLAGGDGNDSASGGKGNDVIDLGDGNDTAYGSYGDDIVYGRDGHDVVHLGSDDDVAYGGDGKDLLYGDRGNDGLYGEDGSDKLYGGRGDDGLDGGAGDDRLYGDVGDDSLWGGSGSDQLDGGKNDDTLFGDADDDLVRGSWGNDHVEGGAGDDTLDGGDGTDLLIGGTGDDIMYGGKVGRADGDADVFRIAGGDGDDRIIGFENGLDRIDLTDFLTDWAALSGAFATVGDDVEMDLASIGGQAGDRLTLQSYALADLDASDFLGLTDAVVA